MRLYCYICGDTIDPSRKFYLLALKKETDRVFLCCAKKRCNELPESGTMVIEVNKRDRIHA